MTADPPVTTPAFLDLTFGGLEALPGPGDERYAGALVRSPGGGGITAVAAARLGLRTALVGVLAAVLHDGLEPQAAIDRPRFHPVGELVNAEPGVDEAWLQELEASGRAVRRWPRRHHYFGGVSAVGRRSSGADPRRSGLALPAG